ncbi:MAG: hypothetical protein OXC26_01445 [Albidovulum sp.]|nr:hypothetical protein [Albidovulum sp.]
MIQVKTLAAHCSKLVRMPEMRAAAAALVAASSRQPIRFRRTGKKKFQNKPAWKGKMPNSLKASI